ncbi:flagellar motor protein MotB [Cellvibrio mixtus]|uniref:flagellar motor protein MotB n=1 Tax=Cellvibrio mixtus TaxID=39650 RepID=UPI000A02C9BF|nr:flagellar motor protein MotB [Cellvibrio mixtus]
MRRRNDKDFEVIVKRRKKSGHEESHSGAWKVAFADFTMAMMALFMVLWVITPQNPKQTSAAEQITNPLVDGGAGVFDGNSKTPLEMPGVPVQPNKTEPQEQGKETSKAEPVKYSSPAELKELADLMQAMALELDAQANVEVQVVPQGLRILIKDDQQRFMFERGSVQLNPHFATLLQRLAGVLAKVGNKLIISGHTDSVPYKTVQGYNNWNLSGDRALRARNVMVESGLAATSVLQVAAQADVMPLRPDLPEDGVNRRIEILLLTVKAEGLYRELFGEQQARVDYSGEKAELVLPSVPAVKPL